MPAALKVDWGAARALFIAGLEVNPIAEQLGVEPKTVQKRVDRGKWRLERVKTKELLLTQPGAEDSVSPSVVRVLSGTFQQWKQEAVSAVAQAGAAIAKSLQAEVTKEGANYNSQVLAFEQFEPASRVLKPFLGLNDQTQSNVSVSFHALSDIPQSECWEIDAVQVEKGDVKSAT